MRTHLLVGTVRHRRSKPIAYELRHAVYYVALDLDEIDLMTARSRLIRRGHLGILSFADRDHLVPPADDVRAGVHAHLRAEGVDPDGWQITLVTNLRVLGYVFDPASFFLCRDREGRCGSSSSRSTTPTASAACTPCGPSNAGTPTST